MEPSAGLRAASAPDVSQSLSSIKDSGSNNSAAPTVAAASLSSSRRKSLPEAERRASLAALNPVEAARESSERQRPSILAERQQSPSRLSTSAPDLRAQVKDAIGTSSPLEPASSPPHDLQESSKKKRFTLKGLFSRSTEDPDPKKEKIEKEKEREKEKEKEKDKEKEKEKDKEKEKEKFPDEKISPATSPKLEERLTVRSPSPAPQHPVALSSSSSSLLSDNKNASRALSPLREKEPSRALSPPREGAAGSNSPGASLKSLWDRIRRRGSSQSIEGRPPGSLTSPPSEAEEAQQGEYEPLATLLLPTSNFFIAYAIGISVPVTEVDSVTSGLCMFYDAHGLLMAFLKAVIEFEIAQSPDVTTLFRSTTFAAVLLSSICKRIAAPYATRLVKPFVEHLRSHATTSLELNPTQTRDAASIPESAMQLADLTANLHDAITNSLSTVPMPLRIICHLLYEAVAVKHPEHATSIVAGLFFLRVICPQIVAPEGLGIVANLLPDQRRSLVLVSKIMQQIANSEPYPSESYMAVMNTFVATRAPLLKTFLEKLSKPPIEADKQLAIGSVFLETDVDRESALRTTQSALFQLAATYTARIEETLEQAATVFKGAPEYDLKKGVAEAVNLVIENRKLRKKK